jgi:hypothetical protein
VTAGLGEAPPTVHEVCTTCWRPGGGHYPDCPLRSVQVPYIDAAGTHRFLVEVEEQPGACGYACPCTTVDGSEYGMRWYPEVA